MEFVRRNLFLSGLGRRGFGKSGLGRDGLGRDGLLGFVELAILSALHFFSERRTVYNGFEILSKRAHHRFQVVVATEKEIQTRRRRRDFAVFDLEEKGFEFVSKGAHRVKTNRLRAAFQIVREPENLLEDRFVSRCRFQVEETLFGIRQELGRFLEKSYFQLFFEFVHGSASFGDVFGSIFQFRFFWARA